VLTLPKRTLRALLGTGGASHYVSRSMRPCLTALVAMRVNRSSAKAVSRLVAPGPDVAKHARMARQASELLPALAEAFEMAEAARPGPVLIDVPKDVQQASVARSEEARL
jgi:acetolactate synthase-1/2/3 large subunit